MKTLKFAPLIFLSTYLLLAGCSDPPDNDINVEEETSLQAEESDFPLDTLAPSKEELRKVFHSAKAKRKHNGEIAHYQFEVRLGPGPFDVVRIHRVVKERRSNRPVRTRGNIFMVHGSSQDFGDIYFHAGVDDPTPKTSAPLYLAANGIDVWGIDLAWTLIPEETIDFSFMEGWGVERDVDHTLAAMSIARFLRGITGQGFGRMNLLGFSYGGTVAYTAAGRETQQHWFQRDIGGIVPVDAGLHVEDETRRELACERAVAGREQIENGNFHTTTDGLRTINHLATSAPDEPSPIIPGFTNYQAALFIGTNPGVFWHFVGVDFSAEGTPVGLLYSDADRWINALGGAPPNTAYMPRLPGVQTEEAWCGEKDVSIDDHLSKITVPILYIGAGGGFGAEAGEWTTSQTASDDITIYEVSLQPEAKRAIDFGHADLWIGNNADNLVWEELRGWLVDHYERGRAGLGLGRR